MIIALLCAMVQGAWAQYSGGSGTETDPYKISTVDDWITLCTNVNDGTSTYSDTFFKLMADITVSEEFTGVPTKMVGRGENVNFRGTFDGGGYTLTVNYVDNSDNNACAPFRFIRNATIRNLHVAGKITKNHKLFAGGLVGVAYGTCYISNCHSSVEIHGHNGDCSSGGFIGELGTSSDPDDTYIDNCFFDGRLEGTHANCWGGFIGWVEDEPDAYITNCLFSPAYVGVNDEGNKTFARGSDIHLTNCYYKHLLTDTQGATKARDMDNETLRMKLGEAWEVYAGRVLPIMTPRSLTGEGTEQSPYLIATFDDWHRLATNVALGESYNDKYFLLTHDISVSRVVGTHPSTNVYNAFGGIFDGGGHTLTINYTTNAEFCGPFCYTYGATIRNLITSGTINTSQKHAGGVVGRNGTSPLTLSNVTSSMTINSSFRGSAEHGGLVGYAINADIFGSAFTGSLLGENSNGCGGLIGWKTNTDNSSVNITDCLFAPSSVTVGTTNAYSLVRNSSGGVVNVTNSYYTQPLGTAQGKQARSIIAGQYVTMQNAGTATEYAVSGITSYGVGIKYNDVLYAGVGDAVSLNLGYAFTDGFEGNGFSVSAGTLSGDENPYTLTMHNKDVLVSANIEVTPWGGEGTEASPFLISYTSQWELLAEGVAVGTDYSGTYFQLTNSDLTVTRMVGIDGQHAFNGIFDGGGHTLTLDYSATADYAAPFRFVDDATIRNLTVAGTINSSKKFAAGLVGQAAGIVNIDHCRSSVTINSSIAGDGTHGGLVGIIHDGETSIRGSLFDGRLLGQLTDNNGGFVGWAANGDSLTIVNSIFDPSEVTMIGDKTFARCSSDEHPTITNCFYTQTFGGVQGKRIYKTQQEVASSGLYYELTSFDKTYYGKIIVTMQVSFDQADEEVKPVPTLMTEDGIVIPDEGIYNLECRKDEAAGTYIVTITADPDASFSIPNARLVGSKTFEFTEVSMYAPKGLSSTATCTTATVSWTGASESYKVRYRTTTLNTVYFTGFETGLPDGWTTIDADGDGNCWDVTDNIPNYAHGGTAFMSSASYHNDKGVLTPDNWLVSPRLPLNGVLKVWMKGQDSNDFLEHVAIYVSTTGNEVADFTDVLLPETVVTNEYVEYTVNLSQYGGEQGYIAIRHFNCTDQYRLDVDDFGLYDANSPSDEWQEIEVTGTTAVITDLLPGTCYAYQVVGIVDNDSYPSAVAVLQTDEEEPQVNHVSVKPGSTSAQISWEGYGRSFNVRYAVDMATDSKAKVTLTVGDVWEDHSGYQMLLDQDANTFGRIIPTIGPLTDPGSASAEDYAEFEYKIPEYADGELTTRNIVFNNSVTIDIPAGTYDWCITNPSPAIEMIFIASFHGNIGGRKDNYVFEAGQHYEFTVSLDGDYDRVDLVTTPMYGEWTQVTVDDGELATLLTGLAKGTKYVVQVQAVMSDGKTSEWSPVVKFTTLGEGEMVLFDDLDNQNDIEQNDGKEVNVTLQGRTLYKDGSWNTLCLPFPMTAAQIAANDVMSGCTLKTLDVTSGQTGFDTTDGTLYLYFNTASEIEAGMPYLVKWDKAADYDDNPSAYEIVDPVFEGVTISSAEAQTVEASTDALETAQMVGSYSPVNVTANDKSILYLGKANTLYYPSVDLQIRSCRAYFTVPCLKDNPEAKVRASVMNFDGEESGIEMITIPSNPSDPSLPSDAINGSNPSTSYFTLDGLRLSRKPTQRGLYILNGQKALIK